MDTGEIWAPSYKPYFKEPDKYCVSFSGDKAKFIRRDGDIETNYEVVVATEDNADIKRISIMNHGEISVDLEVTSLLEVVCGDGNADVSHRSFYGLFINTSEENEILFANRKPRSNNEEAFLAFQTSFISGESFGDFQFETDRAKFIGRGRSILNPISVTEGKPLFGTVGSVLDPVFVQRRYIRVNPGEAGMICFITGIDIEKERAKNIANKYRNEDMVSSVFRLAYARSQVELSYLNVTSDEVKFFDELIKYLV